uniref:C3H1-type domain-containing protein n=1 Tax=Romanomermis culicivorax TaxID=13658 RepID=A0A915HYU7_ROMCU
MPSTMRSAHVQKAGHRPSGAHLQMYSYHGRCTHNDASCQAQHPNSAGPSNAAATGASCCYFCRTRVHPTDQCDRPCPYRHQIRMHRATACPHLNPTMPAAAVVSALAPTPALQPPRKYATSVTLNPSATPKKTSDVSLIVSY